MVKLLIISNPQSPGTDYYRTVGPFTQLERDYPDEIRVTVHSPDRAVWFDIWQADAVLFQRPNGGTIVGYVQEAHRMGKKVLLDIDDLLHHIPDSNPAQGHFEKDDVKKSINEALRLADHIFVSTPLLKAFYSNLADENGRKYTSADKITIVRNGWNPEHHPLEPIPPQRKPARMIFRGSTTHLADLHTIKSELNIMSKDPAFAFVMVGLEKWMLPDLQDTNIQFIKWQTLFTYFQLMRESQPDYGIFPLTDDDFNRCKSNIFALECLRVGALPIVPAGFPEWDMIPGLLRYNNRHDFQAVLNNIKAGKVDKVALVEQARAYISEHLTVQKLNEKRLEVIKSLNS
jgi:hypothetical protein